MKPSILFLYVLFGIAVSCATGAQGAAQQKSDGEGAPQEALKVTSIGILPGFKRGVHIDREERNPFGSLIEQKPQVVDTDGETAKLTEILEGLPVSGLSTDGAGQVRAVLLGDLRLVSGELVPQLIEGQTDELVVQSITASEVVIEWRLEAGRKTTQARLLRRKIDLEPRVQVILPGQVRSASASGPLERKSVLIAPGRSSAVPGPIVPTSGLPPAAP